MTTKKLSVLMVCTGNICRSPTADGVLRKYLQDAGLASAIDVDSAGTQYYHVGEAPDPRAQRHALRRGYDLSSLRARHLSPEDFQRFDLLLAMDRSHLAVLERRCPPAERARLRLFMEFAEQSDVQEVPDPYYGGEGGFEYVLDLIEDGCSGLVNELRARLAPVGASALAG